MARYYSTQRPVMPGGFPRKADVVEIKNFDAKTFCEEIGKEAWGYIEYQAELTKEEADAYELTLGGMKTYYCVTSSVDDKGKVKAAITNVIEAVCYVPELSDSLYTGQDFLDMCNGQPEIADQVFHAVNWQHPETYLDEQGDDELWQCKCGKWYWCYGVDKCPYCGAKKEVD